MREISAETLNDLATKLETLDLSVDEKAVLDRVIERASDATPEVSGFVASEDELVAAKGVQAAGMQTVQAAGMTGVQAAGMQHKMIRLSPMALKLGGGAGLWP